jgi:hypothetical protein
MVSLSATILGVASNAPNWTSKLSAIAEAATALIALCAFAGAIYQLRRTHKTTLETRAHQYLQRYDEPHLLPYISKTHAVLTGDGEATARIATWDEMSFAEQLDALLFLNFWEELAGMYNRNLVDRKIVAEWFGEAAVAYWQMAEWLVLHQRDQLPEESIYDEWEEMCADIKRSQKSNRRK